jgi:hypothetical protein
MGNASGLSRAPLPMIFPSQASANSMSATLWLRAERLDGVAADAVLSDSVGVGSATAAVVSTSDAPRISARIGAVRIADLAETPTLVEQGLFCSARSAFGKRNRTPKYETRRTKQGDRVAHVYSLQRIPKSSAN